MDRRILRVAVHCEAVVNTVDTQVPGDTTESKDWEQFVRVVWFNDLANIGDSTLVLVLSSKVMERTRCAWLTIRGSIVNGDCQGQFPA